MSLSREDIILCPKRYHTFTLMDEKPRGNVSGRGTNAARIHKRCHQLYSEKGDAVMTNVS
jgi:hypothetical protein